MYKVAICDDDKKYHETIKSIMQSYEKISYDIAFYEYLSGSELLNNIWQQYDLVFLDIQMPGLDGNETAKLLREQCKNTVLVFCTSYQRPTPESFKVQPFRYIMKDFGDKMLKEEIPDIIREMIVRAEYKMLNITTDGRLMRIPINSILYVSVAKRGAVVHTFPRDDKSDVACKETIKEIYAVLGKEGFEYAHNSYIINMGNIIQLEKGVLVLKDMTKLNISRSKKEHFDEAFANYLHKKYKRG